MSKAYIVPPTGGGGGLLGFEKLWEGDSYLTKAVDDITGGEVDLTQCVALLIRCTGTVSNVYAKKYFALAYLSVSTGDYGDFSLNAGESADVNITLMEVKNRTDTWFPMRAWNSYSVNETSKPLSFCSRGNGAFTANLHFSIYGIKL